MSRDRLHEALTTLRQELDSGVDLSEADRAQLHATVEDLERVLEAAEQDDTIVGRMEHFATDLEARHPRTAVLLSEVVEVLHRMGI